MPPSEKESGVTLRMAMIEVGRERSSDLIRGSCGASLVTGDMDLSLLERLW